MADDAMPPETAAACADLFAAIERFNMLGLFGRGLYEKFHGRPRYVPVLEGVTAEFMRTTGATLAGYERQIMEMSERETSFDELHVLVPACLRKLSTALAPHFPAELL